MLYIMKKLFIATLAIAALASCNKDQVINFDKFPINFGDAFVDNATKAIYEGETKVDAFKVWGTVTGNSNTVLIFDGANVTREGKNYGDAWTCDVTRYWTPECNYSFMAITDITDATTVTQANGAMPTAINYTATGENDILLGTQIASTMGGATPTNPVAFTMKHLLSRIAVKFTGAANLNADYSYNITNINVTGAYASGVYTIADDEWEGSGKMAASLTFDAVSGVKASTAAIPDNAYVIIPGAAPLTISFTAQVVFGSKAISEIPYTITLNQTDDDTDVTFAKNTSYTLNVTLPAPGQEIQFSISTVEGFGDDTNVTVQ